MLLTAGLLVGCSGGDRISAATPSANVATTAAVQQPAPIPDIACNATRDSLDVASIAYLADTGGYPDAIGDLLGAYVAMPDSVDLVPSGEGDELRGRGWTLRIHRDGDAPPTFTCER
jgi:hypothetical protein